jgi:ubiquinone/menaquinone biosynthesis C-methylase UbiE
MNQQTAWNNEYRNAQGVPTSTRTTPSSAVKKLLDYIAKHEPNLGKEVIDLGCGIGRNALYLAKQGYHVMAVDFAESAIEKFRIMLEDKPEADNIQLQQLNLAETLPFSDNSFDVATDIVTTMTLTPDELPALEKELRRVIKPKGLFLTYVLSDDDGFLAATNPGGISTTVETSGITDNYFTEEYLKKIYKEWEILVLDKVEKTDHFYDKNYTRRIWWMLLQNKKA